MAIYFNPHPVQLEESVTTIETNTTNVPDVYDVTPRIVSVDTVSAASTTWTQEAHALFTVTGLVKAKLFGVCTVDLAGASATVEAGVAGATAILIAQTTATSVDNGDVWTNATTGTIAPAGAESDYVAIYNTDIDLKVATANITGGKITFYCEYIPISTGATVVAAVWD